MELPWQYQHLLSLVRNNKERKSQAFVCIHDIVSLRVIGIGYLTWDVFQVGPVTGYHSLILCFIFIPAHLQEVQILSGRFCRCVDVPLPPQQVLLGYRSQSPYPLLVRVSARVILTEPPLSQVSSYSQGCQRCPLFIIIPCPKSLLPISDPHLCSSTRPISFPVLSIHLG